MTRFAVSVIKRPPRQTVSNLMDRAALAQCAGSCWPSASEGSLIGALLAPEGEVEKAWERHLASVSLEDLDQAARRLLPPLYLRLRTEAPRNGTLGQLKSVYRHTWSLNQVRLRSAMRATQALGDEQIPRMLLKGAALIRSYYGNDPGARYLSDIDIMVRRPDTHRAIELLRAHGWNPRARTSVVTRRMVHLAHGCSFRNGFSEIDLHWQMLHADGSEQINNLVWNSSIEVATAHETVRTPSDTMLLLHVCLHGVRYSPIRHLTWTVDAARIIRGSTTIDWKALIGLAIGRRLTIPLWDALSYLENLVPGLVPHESLKRLESEPISRLEALEYRAMVTPHREVRGSIRIALQYMAWLRRRTPETIDPESLVAHMREWYNRSID